MRKSDVVLKQLNQGLDNVLQGRLVKPARSTELPQRMSQHHVDTSKKCTASNIGLRIHTSHVGEIAVICRNCCHVQEMLSRVDIPAGSTELLWRMPWAPAAVKPCPSISISPCCCLKKQEIIHYYTQAQYAWTVWLVVVPTSSHAMTDGIYHPLACTF